MSRRRSGFPAGTRSAFAPASARRRAYAARITYGGSPPAALKSARTAAPRTVEGGASAGPGEPASTSPTSIAPAVPGAHPKDSVTSARSIGARTRAAADPRAQRERSGHSSAWTFASPASRSVCWSSSAAAFDCGLPVTRPPIRSVRRSTRARLRLRVSASPAMRAASSSLGAASRLPPAFSPWTRPGGPKTPARAKTTAAAVHEARMLARAPEHAQRLLAEILEDEPIPGAGSPGVGQIVAERRPKRGVVLAYRPGARAGRAHRRPRLEAGKALARQGQLRHGHDRGSDRPRLEGVDEPGDRVEGLDGRLRDAPGLDRGLGGLRALDHAD